MAGKLNFAIALKMTTDQFKKGTDFVKKESQKYAVPSPWYGVCFWVRSSRT